MKPVCILLLLAISTIPAFAQTESYDIVTYQPDPTWKKETSSDHLSFSTINNSTRTWLQVAIYKNTKSKGNIENDFAAEWGELITKPYGLAQPAQQSIVQTANGFQYKAASGDFSFNNSQASTMLTTYTGSHVTFSIVINTNSTAYAKAITGFLQSVNINQQALAQLPQNTDTTPAAIPAANTPNSGIPSTKATATGYAFNTTNFDDGWTSTIQPDWVDVSKGNVKVLLHFPKDNINYTMSVADVVNDAWNIYAAQRYTNRRNTVAASPNFDYQGTTFGACEATDATGQSKYVAFYRRAGTWWTEIIEPDRASFIKDFGFDPATVSFKTDASVFAPLSIFSKYNRFAVAASDLPGEWKDYYSSNTFYVNRSTGANAGMSTYTSSALFRFNKGNTYHHELIAVNFSGGTSNVAQTKSDGTYTLLNNWQIRFFKMEGKTVTYDVYFSAIKGGSVLFMNNADYPGSGVFKGFTKKQ